MRRRIRRRCRAGGTAQAPALAQAPAPSKAEDAKKKLEGKRNELQDVEKRKQSLETDVQGLAAERERLNSRLVETADLIKKSEGQLTTIETRLGELDEQQRILKGSLNQRNNQIAKLLSALQRMGRNPPPVLITQREDALQMVRSAMLLSAAFPELGSQAKALTARLTELVRVMTEIRTQRDQLRTEMTRLERCAHATWRPDGGEEGHARPAPVGAETHAHCGRRHLAQRQRPQRSHLQARPGGEGQHRARRLRRAAKTGGGHTNITPNSSPPIPPNSPAALPAISKAPPKGTPPVVPPSAPKDRTSSSSRPAHARQSRPH